jgi:branched-subunit amino acid aminotransferase/4-amino-4-deoxychorismate lyase
MKKSRYDFPPDVFWISPQGKVFDVVGHLSAIQERPQRFGFYFPPQTHQEIDKAFTSLLEQGWVRGRCSGDTAYFQILTATPESIGLIQDLVLSYRENVKNIAVETLDPMRAWEFNFSDFIGHRFPSVWQLNPKKGVKK